MLTSAAIPQSLLQTGSFRVSGQKPKDLCRELHVGRVPSCDASTQFGPLKGNGVKRSRRVAGCMQECKPVLCMLGSGDGDVLPNSELAAVSTAHKAASAEPIWTKSLSEK